MTSASKQSAHESHYDDVTPIDRGAVGLADIQFSPSTSRFEDPPSAKGWSVLSTLGQTLVVVARQPQCTASAVAHALGVDIAVASETLRTLSEMHMVIVIHVGGELRYVVDADAVADAKLFPGCSVGQMLNLFSPR